MRKRQALVDSLRALVEQLGVEFVRNNSKVLESGEHLVDGEYVLPMYLKKGTVLKVNCICQRPATVRFYNYNSRTLLKTFKNGMRTIYLVFENTRLTHDVYLWLEVVASMSKAVYYSDEYKLCD